MSGQHPLGELGQSLERADLLDLAASAFRKRTKPLGEQQQEDLPHSLRLSLGFSLDSTLGFPASFSLGFQLLGPRHRHGLNLPVLFAEAQSLELYRLLVCQL